jgi:N-succinyldiaminopimelate aminotransferase
VPALGQVNDADEFVAALAAARTERTRVLYLNSPNNPSGRVLPRAWIEQAVRWAEREDLWIVSDEVYENFVYVGEHVPVRPLCPARCLSVHSFSKAYAMTGNRVGYIVGPQAAVGAALKFGTHSYFAAPTLSQVAAERALACSAGWLEQTAGSYREVGNQVAKILGTQPPQGGTFCFIDVAKCLDQRGLDGFLLDCVDDGLLVAPGPSFGPFPTHVRLCFTALAPERTIMGTRRLQALIERRSTETG